MRAITGAGDDLTVIPSMTFRRFPSSVTDIVMTNNLAHIPD